MRTARKLFLADWSRSELSSEEILKENMLEISSVVRPSVTLHPENLLLPQTRFQKSLLLSLCFETADSYQPANKQEVSAKWPTD